MNDITLYFQPGACSRVALNALEEIETSYHKRAMNLARGDQQTVEFLAINPNGKIPTLIFNQRVITENPAINYFLHQHFPSSGLLPWSTTDPRCIQGLSDLVWCGSNLHPMVRQVMKPSAFTLSDEQGVRSNGYQKLEIFATNLQTILQKQPYWYGAEWSIIDVYLSWIADTAIIGGFSFEDFPEIPGYKNRVRSRPSFQRALEIEKQAVIDIEMQLPHGAKL